MTSKQQDQVISSDYTKPFDKSDVTFIFDDKSRLYFNRGVLSFFSPVFDALFSGYWSTTAISSGEIPLPGKVLSEFHTLFRFLRKFTMGDALSEENVQILLKLAGEYQIESVLADCSAYILANWKKDPEKHLKAVSLASQYGLKSLMDAFVPLAAMRSLEEISALAPTLPSNVYAAILHHRRIQQQELQQAPLRAREASLTPTPVDSPEPRASFRRSSSRRTRGDASCAAPGGFPNEPPAAAVDLPADAEYHLHSVLVEIDGKMKYRCRHCGNPYATVVSALRHARIPHRDCLHNVKGPPDCGCVPPYDVCMEY